MNLIRIADLSADDIRAIWSLAAAPVRRVEGAIGRSLPDRSEVR